MSDLTPKAKQSELARRSESEGMDLDDIQLSRLLSGRNEPSVLEKEAALERLLAEVAPAPRRKGWRIELLVPALGVAAALALLVLPRSAEEVTGEAFTSRGSQQASLELRCLDPASQERTECRPGSILALAPTPPPDRPYFAAFALRQDGVVLWYFPEKEGVSSEILADEGGPVTRGIVLDSEDHQPGQYELVAVFSGEPLDRQALRRALGPKLRGRGGLDVIRRTFEVAAPLESP